MATNSSRPMIAALQVSLDGFIEGPHGEKDWADSWADAIALIPDVDTFVLGGRMYRTTATTGKRSTPILSVSRHSRSESLRRVKSRTHGWQLRRPTLSCRPPSSASPGRPRHRSSGTSRSSEPSKAIQGKTCMSSAAQPSWQTF